MLLLCVCTNRICLHSFFVAIVKGRMRENGCILTSEELEQRRIEKRKAKKKVAAAPLLCQINNYNNACYTNIITILM
jgi:hypothetical protein